jgi:thioredoxin 1
VLQAQAAATLPRLVDLGATTCKPCIMMEPVLESLREHSAGRMEVEFIDVRANPAAARAYGITSIPTQIYFDADGTERWRHVGFISEEDLLTALATADGSSPAPATR